ncbi:DUF1080 domain-containing protein [Paraglaciecola aquimarina]|uniref:DUF1080 domain-containing protein n=1 Tax=Paraglaciecola aquimarina TaxID=1235557 RepID=A0ABU3SUW2_9ALTE|nr:DUF1080 domain-containing protein [Paraglaciecola aquimarina]MDU0353794.1 DUF1080 domain-containing protein [Paraglaciecola aquimarina]
MKKHISAVLFTVGSALALSACSSQNMAENTDKSANEWVSLFNGKNLDGWTPKFNGFAAGINYKDTFRVEDGLLTVSYDNWDGFEDGRFGHLFTNKSYSNYKIRVEYRFIGEQVTNDPAYSWAYRNNGVMLNSPPAEYMGIDQPFPISAEAQLLGGNGVDERHTGNLCSPSTDIVQQGKLQKTHCIKSNSKTYHGDQWVWFEAEVRDDGSIKHFINNELVFEYSALQIDPSDKWGKKWLDEGNPLKITKGHISVQAETHPTQFRRIEIRQLN